MIGYTKYNQPKKRRNKTFKYYVSILKEISRYVIGFIILFCFFFLPTLAFKRLAEYNGIISINAKKELPIYSLKNDREIRGSFFLGIGNIREVEYYYFYVKNGNGLYKTKVRVDRAVIYEDSQVPKAVVSGEYRIHHSKGVETSREFEIDYSAWLKAELHIPPGTITVKLNDIDLAN